MENDLLPIKFFSKREKDAQRVEGGGSKDLPKWTLSLEEAKIRVDLLNKNIGQIESQVREKKIDFIPTVVKTSISEDAKAKTHRREIRKIFNTNQNNLLGTPTKDEILVKINSLKDLEKIKENVNSIEKNLYGISCIEEIVPFTPDVEISETCKIKLVDYENYELNIAINNLFEKILQKNKLEYKRTNYTDELTIFKINKFDKVVLDEFNEEGILNSIFSIEPMPKYTVSLDELSIEEEIAVKSPKENENNITIGVLDSGISKNKYLKDWIEEDGYSCYPENVIDKKHGTFVSGIINYGDELDSLNATSDSAYKLFDATIFPNEKLESIDEDDLINNIKEAITYAKDKVKIWNLSCGTSIESDTEKFSDFGIALDDLQDKYNILIIKSAGNCDNFVYGKPKSRISKSADSIRSIVVGSIAHKKEKGDLVEKDYPSPFTRVGRGPQFIIKPDVVHYGGNAGFNEDGILKTTGVKSFGIDGKINLACGTSFSTPRITNLIAGLYSNINEEFDPLLLKALLIHSSSYPQNINIPKNEIINQYGYGIPKKVSDILYNSPNEVTLIMRDNIQKGEYIDIFEFPMPDCLIENGYYEGQIIATLVYNPILDSSQISEYCQSNINIYLGTYDNLVERDIEKSNVLNPLGRNGSKNVFSEGCYSKIKMKDNIDFMSERALIEYKDKYYPIKKYAVDLSEFTETNKEKFLKSDKKWYLKLEGMYRDYAEQNALNTGELLNQEFCLIITLRDPKKEKSVYDGVTNKLDEYSFWHNTISLRNNINIHTNIEE